MARGQFSADDDEEVDLRLSGVQGQGGQSGRTATCQKGHQEKGGGEEDNKEDHKVFSQEEDYKKEVIEYQKGRNNRPFFFVGEVRRGDRPMLLMAFGLGAALFMLISGG